MPTGKRIDWEELSLVLREYAPIKDTNEAARILDVNTSTVCKAVRRGDLPPDLFAKDAQIRKLHEVRTVPKGEIPDGINISEDANKAMITYRGDESLTPDDILKSAGIKLDKWEVVSQNVSVRQVPVKSEAKDLIFNEGKITGTVKRSSEFLKANLYTISIQLTRRKRVAVKTIFRPINFSILTESKPVDHDEAGLKILFIADPHFGFRRMRSGLQAIHSREFLNSLLTIADVVNPNVTIWNGDVLDLADFGHFDTEPELLNNTQMAGIELGWVLGQFRQKTNRQIIIEGNHELRLEKAIVKNLAAGYQLTPIHDLGGHPLLSVPRFLGLDSLDTEWVGGYPNASVKIGTAKFMHGNVVRKGSAKTVSSMINDLTSDRFFGHIHRFELAQKYVEDEGRSIFAGSPGCACNKTFVPGSNDNHNWQLGAFLIHINRHNGTVENVEHITAEKHGSAWFRGQTFQPKSYMKEFRDSLPAQYAKWFDGF